MSEAKRRSKSGEQKPLLERLERIIHKVQSQAYEKEGSAWSLLHKEVSRQCIDAFERKAPVVWTTSYVFPMELIAAAGLIPFDFEIYAGILSGANQAPAALREADRASAPQDTCTIHRIALGGALQKQFPQPDILVSTSHYCDGKPKTNEIMADLYGVEYCLLDMPLPEVPAAKGYLESQLRDIFEKLCAIGGKKPDESLLVEPIRRFNEMTVQLKRVNRLRMESPSPRIENNRGFAIGFLASLLYATPKRQRSLRRWPMNSNAPSHQEPCRRSPYGFCGSWRARRMTTIFSM